MAKGLSQKTDCPHGAAYLHHGQRDFSQVILEKTMIGRLTAMGLAVVWGGTIPLSASAEVQFVEANSTAGITDTEETFGTRLGRSERRRLSGHLARQAPVHPHGDLPQSGRRHLRRVHRGLRRALGRARRVLRGRTDTHGLGSADFDNDGDIDLLEITGADWPFLFWVNDGTGHLTNRFAELGIRLPLRLLRSARRAIAFRSVVAGRCGSTTTTTATST